MREFTLIFPMIILALTLAMVVVAEITYHGERTRMVGAITLTGLLAALIQTLLSFQFAPIELFDRALSVDGVALFFQVVFILAAGLSVVAAMLTQEVPEEKRTEYCALILASSLAMSLLAGASDLLMVFLCLQFVNILGLFLAGYGKDSPLSAEASIKYLMFWSVSSALLLYGMSALFSAAHTLNLHDIQMALIQHPLGRESLVAIFCLFLFALTFQVGSFPMYLWVPDVLEGAPTPVSGFLSFGIRAAGFSFAIRFLNVVFAQRGKVPGTWEVLGPLEWPQILSWIIGATLLIGSLLAVRQTRAKRLVACLVVTQSGFLLMGLLVLNHVGIAAVFYNLTVEVFSLLGAFFLLAFLRDQVGSDRLEDLRGALARAVPECIYLVLFLVCLVGLPPMPGFLGKFALMGSVVQQGWTGLALIGVFSQILSAAAVARFAYYLVGDFRTTIERDGLSHNREGFRARQIFLLSLTLPLIIIGVGSQAILNWAGKALQTILW